MLSTNDTNITKYAWDARNRLAEVSHYVDYAFLSGNSPDQVVDYLYDVENRWIGENIDSNGDGQIDHETRFAYDGNQIVLEFETDVSGATGSASALTAADLSHRYLWQPNAVDQLMADEQVTNVATPGNVVLTLGDNLGTVRDLAVMDSTGTTSIANHRAFDSYGNLVSQTNAAVDCLFGFTARALDSTTGLQNNLNRWYDAKTGGWLSKDPIGYCGGDANTSRYVGNSPTNATDPSGLQDPSGMVGTAERIAQDIEARQKKKVAVTYDKLVTHCNGTEAETELATILNVWAKTPNTYANYGPGGYCKNWLNNFLAALPPIFRLGTGVLKVTPEWFPNHAPSLGAGYGMLLGISPGHYAAKIQFPDGFVVYLDNGWAGTGGIFAFGSIDVPNPKEFILDSTPPDNRQPKNPDPVGWPK